MQLVEKKTAPSTAPSYRPPIETTCRAVDRVAAASYGRWCYLKAFASPSVELTSVGAWSWGSMGAPRAIYPHEIIVVDTISVPTAHVAQHGNDAIVLDLANVWQQLKVGFFTTQMFPATKIQGPVTSQVIPGTVAAVVSAAIEECCSGGRLELVGHRDRHPLLAPFQKLSDNWDAHGAKPPGETALSNAEAVLRLAREANLTPRSVSPSAEGGVAIIFKTATRYADIECLNSSEILATISDGNGHPVVWEITVADVPQALSLIRAYVA